ncbi:hypothetical protein OIU77_007459 [Salix suchowensis]|uniref:DUF7032 domain-containing protein n=1 Tax=Salix suchowensis TaxID=1278906 RepID=A0ABQ9AG68_9ROSI|nr:hypothetical protein OIU77_007459 [Salix suchowensis]
MTRPENDPITLSNDLLHSLLDQQIPLIQSFKGKWSLIKSKLADLQAQLNDFSELQTSITNSLSLDLLHSISQTLNDAHLLAEKCLDTNLTEGKLKTQSDIDSILAKLNQNVKDCEVLIKSGVLQDGTLSGSGSKRELVRAEFRNLITRLQIGSTESKNAAMDTVLSLIQEDDKNVMIAVAQGLWRCLSCGVMGVRSAAARAVYELGFNMKTRKLIGELGCISPLIKMLDGKAVEEKEAAAKALSLLVLHAGPSLDIILRCAWNLNLEDGSLIDPGEKRLHFPYNILLWSSINILPEQILKLDTGLFIDVCGYGPAFILGSDPTPSTRVDANLNG